MRSHLFSRRLWTKDFVLILLVCTIASYPNSILISLLPVYVLDLGGTNTWTGMMMTGLTLLGMVTNAAVAPLIDRVGRKKLLVLGNGLYALNAAMFCFTEDLTALFVLRVLCGFTQGVFFPVPPIVAADNAPEDLMVDAMGLFGAASSIAFAVTPTIGLFLYETFGPQVMFLSGAAMGAVSFVLSLFVTERYHRPQEARGERERSSFRFDRAFVTMILLPSLVNFFVLFGNSAVQSFLTPCGLSRGIQQISLFFLVNQGVVILARLLVGRVLERFSKRVCVLYGLWMTAGGTLLIAVAAHLPAMLVAAALLGLGQTAATQILQAEVLLTSPVDRRGVAGTTYMLLGNIGGAGTGLWGAVSSAAGYGITYALAGGATLLGWIFHGAYWGQRKKGEAPCEEASSKPCQAATCQLTDCKPGKRAVQ